jgi:gamma-glutamylcyclotransferase (GGCT)/AIG2-like uncharacterized protein YtfP
MDYFAYGSNLNKAQMRERCPACKPRFPVTLPNYRIAFVGWSRIRHGAVATIRPARGDKVRGAVYDVSEADLHLLDKAEGYPQTYDRIKVTVFDEDGTPYEAMTYVRVGQAEEAPPSEEYRKVIQQGYRDWGLV